jgi:long-chain acyl-CoA synthetase
VPCGRAGAGAGGLDPYRRRRRCRVGLSGRCDRQQPGDLGTKDDEGFITIVDRKKDMVLRGGYNVYPREVEEVLLRHDAVAQVAVIAVPDPQLGEEVCAVVVRAPEAEGSDEELGAAIITWSKDRLAKYKYPRSVEFVEAMPLGPSGKVLKRELVERYA